MRKVLIAGVAAWAVMPVGCSKNVDPVAATPEAEVEQKQAEKDTREAELIHQKDQKTHRNDAVPADGEVEERERQKPRHK